MSDKNFTYNIRNFLWSKHLNTFFGDMGDLWETSGKYNYAFPSQRKQFRILNEKTGGFRRFRLKYESLEEHYCTELNTDDCFWATFRCMVFESEDGIICKVYE